VAAAKWSWLHDLAAGALWSTTVRYDELTQMVTGSSPEDWEVLGRGPVYLYQLGNVSSGDHSQPWVEVDSHYYLAVYKPDISLRLAWGLTLDNDLTTEWVFPDRSMYRYAVDAFWQGALVTRWTMLGVDGGRCYLPDADRGAVQTGESFRDYETVAWTAKASEVAVARLLDRIIRGPSSEFDSKLDQAGIVEVPD
jgi:hypothetical protein